jgi:predicted DNA-binding transcriptional regulator AlpA
MTPRLVGAAEIGQMLGGISRQRVYQLTAKDDFPAPLEILSTGKVWAYEDVKAYALRNGRTIHPVKRG